MVQGERYDGERCEDETPNGDAGASEYPRDADLQSTIILGDMIYGMIEQRQRCEWT